MGALKPNSRTELRRASVAEPRELEGQLKKILERVPPFPRLPQPGRRCPHCGLSRTGMVELVAPLPRNDFSPPVEAIYRKRSERARRGIWLIPAENLFRYLLGLVATSRSSYEAMRKSRQKQFVIGKSSI
jgi:hypothetical protein